MRLFLTIAVCLGAGLPKPEDSKGLGVRQSFFLFHLLDIPQLLQKSPKNQESSTFIKCIFFTLLFFFAHNNKKDLINIYSYVIFFT